jgi:hypothetical protein
MARTKMVNGVEVTLTESEEARIDEAEVKRQANLPKNRALQEIRNLEKTVTQRRIREMTTADGAKWVDDVEKLIAVERGKL